MVRVPIRALEDWCNTAFIKCGLTSENVRIMTDTLVKAEVTGVSSHGLVRLPFYCRRLLDKGSNRDPQLKLLVDLPSLILVDGDNGPGQIVSVKTMQIVIERAKQHGICFAGVRNSSHFGLAGYYPMMAAEQGLIGIAASNTGPVMAVWGGSTSVIGNNPLAVAIPTGKSYPIVLDIAMSVVAGGKVRLEAVKGGRIPMDWILDAKGRRTTDPNDLGSTGTLLPLGHKGSGLAIVIEVLANILTGAGMSSEMGVWFRDTSVPVNVGHFLMAINIESLIPMTDFLERLDRLVHHLKSSPPMEGSSGVYMPGEIEHQKQQASEKDGVPLSPEVLRTLNEFAAKVGIDELFIEPLH